ncbi:hypothetical protein INT45_006887 [Circinella minor]|uniref:Attractin/MKLN-like beta-propeller domain-containing protein n=1 Tax=Circinella minor TaxID=1195481 RepID=A0A8H7VFM4_9FUNG|nr:hypothetical protein INT45_006887 [Circinella minor]
MNIVILLSSLYTTHCEYPITPSTTSKLPTPAFSTGFVINETLYVYGGQIGNILFSNQFTRLSFDSYGVVHYEDVNSNGPEVLYPTSVVFPNNDSVAIIGGRYDGYYPNVTDSIRAQVYSFSQNTWTTLSGLDGIDSVPPHRKQHTSVRAANGLIYIHGGISSMNNFTLLRDHWSYDTIAQTFINLTTPPIGLYGGTATALPDSRIVYVGGWYSSDEMDPEFSDYFIFNQSAVYNPDDDSWELQALDASAINNPEVARVHSNAVLGDNLGIIGVDDEYYNVLWILDTHTWIWSAPSVDGLLPRARTGSSIGRINNEYAVLCFGGAGTRFFTDIDVLKLSDMTGDNGGSRTNEELQDQTLPKWVYNITTGATYDEINEEPTSSISKATISAIGAVCGGLACLILLESPETAYTFDEPIYNDIQLPDIRFCLEGYTIGTSPTDGSTYPRISCTKSDESSCTNYITLLDLSYHRPRPGGDLGSTQCYLFRGEPFHEDIVPLRFSSLSDPQTSNGASIDIIFRVLNRSETGKIYISFYHPERDPNRNVYFAQHMPLFSDKEIGEWMLEDAFRVTQDYLEPNEYANVDYQFERTETLILSGWNYFGFASQYKSIPHITTTFQKHDRPVFSETMIGSITLSPASFITVVHRGQKIYSLMNALGFVGGLYGIITAIQAAVFGYRPQSPFGIIHHWSFGRMKRSIDRGLKDRFGKYKSPVPLGTPEEQNENQEDDIPNLTYSRNCDSNSNNSNSTKIEPSNERKQFTVLNVEENLTQCNSNCQNCFGTIQEQARQIELIQERTQLLEHLFRSYYVDDEVFKKVDISIKQPEGSMNQQHHSISFPQVRTFQNLFRRTRVHTGYHNTTSSDSVALVSNSSATNSNNPENDMVENNNIESEHHRNK